MSQSLSEQEIELLSAFLDGEVSEAERVDAERLIDASAEARTWLRDAYTVRSDVKLNTGSLPDVGSAAPRLTGDSIVAASGSGRWIVNGGALKSASIALATLALLVLGAGWFLFDPSADNSEPLNDLSNSRGQSYEFQSESEVPLLDVEIGQDETVSIGPEQILTLSDLNVDLFLVDGIISGTDIESGLLQIGTELDLTDKERIEVRDAIRIVTDHRSVHSGENVRTAVVRAGGSYFIRADLLKRRSDLLESVRNHVRSPSLASHLEHRVRSVKEESDSFLSALRREGAERPDDYFIEIDLDDIRYRSAAGSLFGVSHVQLQDILSNGIVFRKLKVRESRPRFVRRAVSKNEPEVRDAGRPNASDDILDNAIDSLSGPAFIDLQIIVSSDHGRVIISDAVDTSYVQQFKTGSEGSDKIYLTLDRLSKLTDSLNILIGREALDNSLSTEKRARQIVTKQQLYIVEVKKLLRELQPDSVTVPSNDNVEDTLRVDEEEETMMYTPPQLQRDPERSRDRIPMGNDAYNEPIVETNFAGRRSRLTST